MGRLKNQVLFNEIACQVLAHIKNTCRPRTYQVAIAPVRYLTDTFGKWPAHRVLPGFFHSTHVPRMMALKPNLSLNSHRQLFIQILNTMYSTGIIKIPPVKIKKPSKTKVFGREVSDIELGKLLKFAVNEDLKLQIEIAVLTGMRLREILRLKWEYIDFQRISITLPAYSTKTNKMRSFPIARHLADKILARKHKSKSEYVFPMKSDLSRPVCDNKRAWLKTLLLAGIKFRFHDLRHTAASRKVKSGVLKPVVAAEIGMSVEVLDKIYTHINIEDMRESAEAVRLPINY